MVEWLLISLLLLGGVGLIIIEIIFVPGTTVVGIGGVLLCIYAIYMGFDAYGSEAGYLILIGTLLINGGALVYGLKSGAWDRFALKTSNKGKVNEGSLVDLRVGDEGEAVSALRPMGKALFGEKEYEVRTIGNFLDSGKKVKIVSLKGTKIIVEPIKT